MKQSGSKKFMGESVSFPDRSEFRSLSKEILSNNVYDLDGVSKDGVMIDIGAYIGLSSIYLLKRYYASKIIAFEPNPFSYQFLSQNCLFLEEIETHNMGVSKSGKEVSIHIPADERWLSNSSLLKNSWNGVEFGTQVKSSFQSLENVLEGNSSIALVKVDIEGYEYALFNSDINLEMVENIVLEMHPVKGSNYKRIEKTLRKAGFKLKYSQDGSSLDTPERDRLYILYAIR